MPQDLLAVTLVDLRANLEQMLRVVTLLDAQLVQFRKTAPPISASPMLEHLGHLRALDHLNTELLFAADTGLGALMVEPKRFRASET